MNKVIFGLFFIFSIILITLMGNQEQTETPPKSPIAKQTTTLRFGHNLPEDSALHQAALMFSDRVQKKTKSEVNIEVYPAQQLGNDHQMVEMARKGELDILLTPTAKMSIPVPSMQYADLPFFFPERNDVYAMLDGEPGRMLFKDLKEIGLIGMAFWENGFKHFTGNTELLTPDDFIGKKIRVMKSRIIMEQFKSFGAEPIAIDFHATKQALADGVVDGHENPLIAIYSMGFHEVQSDLVLSEHAYLGYVLSMSDKSMQKLPFHIQTILLETAAEITPWEREETQRREQALLEKIRTSGTKVHQLTNTQKASFAEKTVHIPSRFEDVIGTALISKTEELLFDKHNPNSSDDYLIIGLNADLTNSPIAGLSIKRGIQLAIDDINQKGGVLGKPLRLIARDHQVIASRGIENMNFFINRSNVVAVVGGKHSAVIAAELDIVNNAKIPYLIPWAATPSITDITPTPSSIYRASANDRMAAKYIARYALKGHSTPVIIAENTIWGRSNVEQMKQFFSKMDVVVPEFVFNLGQQSYEDLLTKVSSSNADSVILIANSNEGDIIVNQLAKLESKLPIISHWGILGNDFFKKNRKILTDIDLRFFQTFIFSPDLFPKAEELFQRYTERYGADNLKSSAQHAVAQSYDLVQLLALAIEQVGTTDRATISQALENLPPYNGVMKRYNPAFSAENHDALDTRDFFMAKFNEDGQIIRVN